MAPQSFEYPPEAVSGPNQSQGVGFNRHFYLPAPLSVLFHMALLFIVNLAFASPSFIFPNKCPDSESPSCIGPAMQCTGAKTV